MNTELVVLLAREFGWTPDEIGKLGISQAKELTQELFYQKSLDDYRASYHFAFLASSICSFLAGKEIPIEQFIGVMPKRANVPLTEEDLITLAKQTRYKKRGEENDECSG